MRSLILVSAATGLLLLLLASIHCTARVALPAPADHRPTAQACPTDRPPGFMGDGGAPKPPLGTTCERDSDCTMGNNGRCLPQSRINGTYCSYDACTTDTDCPSGQLCECGQVGFPPQYGRTANTCIQSNCRVDADCAGGSGFCSPTFDYGCGSYSGIVGYYCHTSNDDCTSDDECNAQGSSPNGAPGGGFCAWMPETGKWSCSYSHCSG
jgi:hypothetical protein